MTEPGAPTVNPIDARHQAIREFWTREGVFAWDPDRARSETFVIDTPPPTASGTLHLGSVFSYIHTDLAARYQRMTGKNVFYPMGWDDNGLPTLRRIQNLYGVRLDPSLSYQPDLHVERLGAKEESEIPVSRRNFLELAHGVLAEDEAAFASTFERAGLSVDWSMDVYTTIGERSRAVSQRDFLDLVQRGEAELREGPTMWDIDMHTAVAQAEVEDREEDGAYYRIAFAAATTAESTGTGASDPTTTIEIATTRPELLGACIALIAHPDDERYQPLFGTGALTPLFQVRVPIVAHPAAEPDKGTGIMMVCTFGDGADVDRWQELGVPARVIVGRDGRIRPVRWGEPPWDTMDPATAQANHDAVAGLPIKRARAEIAKLLVTEGALLGEPERIRRPVKFYEKGERPLEYVISRQWFIHLLRHRDALVEQGRKVTWHPEFMRKRYENWVDGLNQDWCVSRQRPFGVPIPVWYEVGSDGEARYDRMILPKADELPVDPASDAPPGFTDDQRNQPNGFIGDPDAFDTWVTSSLTPLLISGWPDDKQRFELLYPNDLRPNAHDIIRTWDFYTIVRSYLRDGSIPWRHAAISGFITDPDRKKMSKSKGNAVLPVETFVAHGADAVRYWSASFRLGLDAPIDANVFKEGRRLSTKLTNAARFVRSFEGESGPPVRPLDRAFLARLRGVVVQATAAWDAWEHAGGLAVTEAFFWSDFCDTYLELVKARAYAGDPSAIGTLRTGLSVLARLLAPILAFTTEEVWLDSLVPDALDNGAVTEETATAEHSVHRQRWPVSADIPADVEDDGCFDAAVTVLSAVRKAKSDAKVSIKVPVERLAVRWTSKQLGLLSEAHAELFAAGNVDEFTAVVDEEAVEPVVAVALGEAAPARAR